MNFSRINQALAALALSALSLPASALVFTITVDGQDAIFLAGRTDLVIPAANLPWTGPGDHLIRHGGATPEEAQETLPPFISVNAGDVIRVLDPAVGGVNFFNGLGPPFFGPGGNGLSGSNLTSLGGISGYIGPQGPLAGVFLSDAIPLAGAPATLDFSPGGLGIDFASLSPELGQIFYIGDGINDVAVLQEFIAPVGATRLFFAIPDGFGFVGGPGAYDDNDGSYRIRVGVNEIPTLPLPGALALLGAAAGAFALGRRR
jgi:hypothetical protein